MQYFEVKHYVEFAKDLSYGDLRQMERWLDESGTLFWTISGKKLVGFRSNDDAMLFFIRFA